MKIFKNKLKNSGNSDTNTILIVVLILLVGLGVWWFTTNRNAPKTTDDLNVNVDLTPGNNTNQ